MRLKRRPLLWAARAEIATWERAEGRDGAKQKRRCYQRRSGALRVEPAHFDWRWRERPALALLAWEALARDPLARLRRIQVESIGTTINFRPAAITNRDIAASALLIASRLALTAGPRMCSNVGRHFGSPTPPTRTGGATARRQPAH
jgi:hypothetical protein